MSLRVERWNKSDKPIAQALRRRLESEGYSVFEWITVDAKSYTLRAGDRDFLPANTAHSAFVPGNEPVRYLIGAKY